MDSKKPTWRLEQMIGKLRGNKFIPLQGSLIGHATDKSMQGAHRTNVTSLEFLMQTYICKKNEGKSYYPIPLKVAPNVLLLKTLWKRSQRM